MDHTQLLNRRVLTEGGSAATIRAVTYDPGYTLGFRFLVESDEGAFFEIPADGIKTLPKVAS